MILSVRLSSWRLARLLHLVAQLVLCRVRVLQMSHQRAGRCIRAELDGRIAQIVTKHSAHKA